MAADWLPLPTLVSPQVNHPPNETAWSSSVRTRCAPAASILFSSATSPISIMKNCTHGFKTPSPFPDEFKDSFHHSSLRSS